MTEVPIFVINLKRDHIKKAAMKIRCEEQSLRPTFINAVNGLMKVGKKEGKIQDHNLAPGEIGCALSHKMIYKMIVEKGIAWSVVLEDDVRLGENFPEIIKSFENFPKNCEILLLGHHSCNARDLPTAYAFRCAIHLTGKYRISRPLEDCCGTYGYMISLQGARKLLAKMERIRKPADHYTGDSSNPSLWILNPPVVLIDEKLDRLSTIEKERKKIKQKQFGFKETLLRIHFFRKLHRLRHSILFFLKGLTKRPCQNEEKA